MQSFSASRRTRRLLFGLSRLLLSERTDYLRSAGSLRRRFVKQTGSPVAFSFPFGSLGKAGELVERGDNTYGGKYVVNPSGGLISKGHPLGATGSSRPLHMQHARTSTTAIHRSGAMRRDLLATSKSSGQTTSSRCSYRPSAQHWLRRRVCRRHLSAGSLAQVNPLSRVRQTRTPSTL